MSRASFCRAVGLPPNLSMVAGEVGLNFCDRPICTARFSRILPSWGIGHLAC